MQVVAVIVVRHETRGLVAGPQGDIWVPITVVVLVLVPGGLVDGAFLVDRDVAVVVQVVAVLVGAGVDLPVQGLAVAFGLGVPIPVEVDEPPGHGQLREPTGAGREQEQQGGTHQ